MKVAFFYGNGFDLALGLNTTYRAMIENRLPKTDVSSFENKLLRWLLDNLSVDQWCNAELMLGKLDDRVLPREMGNIDQIFVQALQFVHDALLSQLREQEKLLFVRPNAKAIIEKSIIDLLESCASCRGNDVCIVPLSLNYTNSLEQILQTTSESDNLVWHDVIHLHGSLKEDWTTFGLDNSDQIPKQVRLRMRSADQILLKQRRVTVCRAVEWCLSHVDAVVFYGVSFGETDLMWWRMVNQCLEKTLVVPIICLYPDFKGQSYADAQGSVLGMLRLLGWKPDSLYKVRFPKEQPGSNLDGFGDFLGLSHIVKK